jgi:phosphatidate cytidylyltransferase
MKYTRELTTLVAGPVAILIIGWAPPLVFDAAVGICALLALYEFLVMGRHKGFHLPIPLCMILALFILAAFVVEQVSVEMGVFATLLAIPAFYVLRRGEDLEEALPSSGIAVLSTLYVGMLGGSLIRLRGDFPVVGPKLVFFLLLVVWTGDAGAYYTGKAFGRHKLSPRISPKKTIEGGIGGLTASVIAAIVIHFTFFRAFPLLHAVIAGFILSAAGIVGDLAESMWKRSADVKDSGTLIPGHGGFLDRFDSIFFTAPILYTYWSLIVRGFKSLNIMQG